MKIQVSRDCLHLQFVKAKPFLAVVFLQVGLAGMDIISKAALNKGMSNYVLVVYRHAIATIFIGPFALALDKKIRPKMTASILAKIMLLSLLEPIMDQNLYFLGMKYTTATFAAAMANVLPAITFLMACFFRLEKIKWTSTHSQAKIVGTVATVGGAMIMTLARGPTIHLPWMKEGSGSPAYQQGEISFQRLIKGALMIIVGCFSWACFVILQVITLRTYPAELSLTAWICLFGTAGGAIVAAVMEKDKAAWTIKWDAKFFAAVYGGTICSGIAYYVQGAVMKERGPVFVAAFSPLSMVVVAILSSIVLGEQMYLGRIVGAIVIITGLYFVVWGKSKDYKSPLTEERRGIAVDQHVDANEPIVGNSNVEIIANDASSGGASK